MTAINNHIQNSTEEQDQKQAPQKADWESGDFSVEFTATYSAEDNKLRLYADQRLDDDLYKVVSGAGFKYAKKQELFFAPSWTPEREDLCIKLAGEITAEQTTIVERAEAKVDRLENLAIKRSAEGNAFIEAANRISRRFQGGQPILVGHHSEKGARKDQARIDSAMNNAVKALNAVDYWGYRAEGVARHANRKANSGVRSRRIKKLLAELRGFQRDLNHAHVCFELWTSISEMTDDQKKAEKTKYLAGTHLKSGAAAPYIDNTSLWSLLDRGEIGTDEAIEKCLEFWSVQAEGVRKNRWIAHTLNRLAYERYELGEVGRFEGELTPVILQAFAREQGADSPKASQSEAGFLLCSSAPLPSHLADGKTLELSVEEWRDLMQSVGHEVVIKERKASAKQSCPIINPTPEQAEKLQAHWNALSAKGKYGSPSERLEMTQAHYSANSGGDYGRYSTISIDAEGKQVRPHRKDVGVAVCRVRVGSGQLYGANRVITLTDKPQKDFPFCVDSLCAEGVSGE